MSASPPAGSMEPVEEARETHMLVRRKDRRLVAGVAGGLADHFGVSAGWFRLGFVLTTFLGGTGVAAYVLLWFLIRREDLPRSAGQQLADRFPDAPAWLGIVLIAVGVLSLTSRIGDSLGVHLGSLAWALLLIGGGLALFRRSDDLERVAAPSPSAIDTTTATVPLPGMPVVRARRPPRERSPLGWLALGLALAASGLVAALRNAGTVDLSLAQTLAIPLTILGVGLLVGAWIGRARWTMLLGLVLVPVVLVASAFTVPMNGTYGDITVARSAQVRDSYVLSGGGLRLDLSKMDPAELPPVIDVQVGAGGVDVSLPPNGVRVEATVNIGDVHMARSRGGVDVVGSLGDPNATTVVVVHVDVGEVTAWYAMRPASIKVNGGSK
jgi:phage shock protein PspC (stress-responsive transcriptional regulator)